MYARVARWEGADAETIERTTSRINEEAADGPPEGLPAKSFVMLVDKENGRTMGITFFETEEDYAKGDATLNEMSPPDEGMGQRVAVDKYEVAVEVEV